MGRPPARLLTRSGVRGRARTQNQAPHSETGWSSMERDSGPVCQQGVLEAGLGLGGAQQTYPPIPSQLQPT